jgi:hypothetical protein
VITESVYPGKGNPLTPFEAEMYANVHHLNRHVRPSLHETKEVPYDIIARDQTLIQSVSFKLFIRQAYDLILMLFMFLDSE